MNLKDLTSQITFYKNIKRDIDEKWVEWAVAMLMAGNESESILELAGITKPFNQFEMDELTDRVFSENKIDLSNESLIQKNFAVASVREVLSGTRDMDDTLQEFKSLSDYFNEDEFIDFYCLWWAKDDLKYSNSQQYWEGATSENIDEICLNYFKEYISKNG